MLILSESHLCNGINGLFICDLSLNGFNSRPNSIFSGFWMFPSQLAEYKPGHLASPGLNSELNFSLSYFFYTVGVRSKVVLLICKVLASS